jgi:hypothetical protein
MKVQLDTAGWVQQVSKIVPPHQVNAESIGLIYFRGDGVRLFRQAVEEALRHPAELKSWYLSIIDRLAKIIESIPVRSTGCAGARSTSLKTCRAPASFSVNNFV